MSCNSIKQQQEQLLMCQAMDAARMGRTASGATVMSRSPSIATNTGYTTAMSRSPSIAMSRSPSIAMSRSPSIASSKGNATELKCKSHKTQKNIGRRTNCQDEFTDEAGESPKHGGGVDSPKTRQVRFRSRLESHFGM